MSCLLYALGLIGDSYQSIIKPFVTSGVIMYIYAAYDFIMGVSRNGLFMGSSFVLIGYLFAQKNVKVKTPVALIGFVVSVLCMLAEAFGE